MGNDIHEETCEYFASQGHHVEILTPGAGPAGESQPCGDAVEQGLVVHRLLPSRTLATSIKRQLSSRLLHYDRFLDLLSSYRSFIADHQSDFDVIHVEAAYPFGAIAAIADPEHRIPYVINVQGADVMNCPEMDWGYTRHRVPHRLTSLGLRKAAAVRANSLHACEHTLNLGANPQTIDIIPRNVRSGAYPPSNVALADFRASSRRFLIERLGLPEYSAIIMALGRLHPVKGIEYLVQAMPAVKLDVPKAALVVCGPSRRTDTHGDYIAFLRDMAVKQGVGTSTVFTGEVKDDEVPLYLAGSDLLAVPSIEEALNKVVIEAAAVGTPSVVTDTTGIADYMRGAKCGLIVPPRSASKLAAAIKTLLLDGSLRREALTAGPSFAEAFRTAPITGRLLEFYDRQIFRSVATELPVAGVMERVTTGSSRPGLL